MYSKQIRLATYASVSVATFLIGFKLLAWWMTGSVSLQASLIDSLLDACASFINVFAVHHALKPADREHRFGHGKLESLAGLGQSLFIGLSAMWLLHEAWNRFSEPLPIEQPDFGILIMALAIIVTFALVSYQSYVVRISGSTAIAADMLHYRSDLLINAAVIVSLLGSHYLGVQWIDPLFGILIGAYILWTAWVIIVQAFNILMDRELDDEFKDRILEISLAHKEVKAVEDLRTRSSGLQKFAQMELMMDPILSLEKTYQIVLEVEAEIQKEFPNCQVLVKPAPFSKRG